MKMEKCWANSFGGCGDKITGEHLISKSILNKRVLVQGFSWCKDEPKEIGRESFVNKFLCNHHNNALSLCDTEIATFISSFEKFIRATDKFKKHGFSLKKIPIVYPINGLLIEKWFIKTLINISLTNKNKTTVHFDKALPFLFSDTRFEKPYGFSFAVNVGYKIKMEDRIEIMPFFNQENKTNELAGGIFTFRGFKVIIYIPCSKPVIQDTNLTSLDGTWMYGNLQLNWHNEEINQEEFKGRKKFKTQVIKFSWN